MKFLEIKTVCKTFSFVCTETFYVQNLNLRSRDNNGGQTLRSVLGGFHPCGEIKETESGR
jgi:hypothetical protein